MKTIKISEEFTKEPYKKEDGIIFRDIILMPRLVRTHGTKNKISIDFNDCFGFTTVFIDEVFGGLIRNYGYDKKTIMSRINIISDDDETIPSLIEKYLNKAEQEKR